HDGYGSPTHGPEFYGGSPAANGATLVPVTIGGDVTGIDAQLPAGGRISGTITKAVDGTPVLACVSATTTSGDPWYSYGTSDSAGHYVLDGLAAEPQSVTAYPCDGSNLLGRSFHDKAPGQPGD